MTEAKNLYAILNVSPDADPVVIEAAYRVLIKRYHPDKLGPGAEAEERRAAEINHAFAILRNPAKRARYDEEALERSAATERFWAGSPHLQEFQTAAAQGWRPPPPPARAPARRISGLAFFIGAAALVGTVVVFAHEITGGKGNVAASPPAEILAERPQEDEAASLDPEAIRQRPVSPRQVSKAVAQVRQIVAQAGIGAAADYSENCFQAQRQTLGVAEFDYCVAFDQAASRLARKLPQAEQAADMPARFTPENLSVRHINAGERLSSDSAWVADRLDLIRVLTGSVMNEAAKTPLPSADALALKFAESDASLPPEPMPVVQAPALKVVHAAPRPSRRSGAERSRRRAEAQPAPQPPKQADDEFLERVGGIY